MSLVKNIKIGSNTYQINATQLEGKSASEYALKTDLSKFDKLALKIVSTLPTAAAATQDAIYLVAHGGHSDSPDSYDEYITVESSGKYSWEKIGNTDVKLDGYLKTTDVIDALNNQSATNPLSANQGYQLNQRLDEVETYGSKLVTVEDDIIGINGSISSLSTRLTTAESNIADRYTKGESDGKYLPIDGTAKFANVMKSAPGQYQQMAPNASNRPANWDEINAVCYNGIRAQLVSSSLGDKTEPDGTIMTFGWDRGNWDTQLLIPGGDSTGKVYNPMLRTQSGTQTYGSWHYIPYMEDVVSSSGGTINGNGVRCPLEIKGGVAGTRQNIRLYPSEQGGWWTAIAFLDSTKTDDNGLSTNSWCVGARQGFFGISKNGDGLYTEGSSYLRNNNDTWEFKGNKVLFHCDSQNDGIFYQRGGAEVIDTSTIGQQVVKSFTATEIDHGDKFKGDLESTTKVSAPVIEVTNHLTNSDGNDINLPGKAGTLTTTDDLNNYVAKGSSTSSSTTGITASASAPTFTGTAHGHTINDNGHAHTYSKTTSASAAGWNISVDGSTLIFTSNTSVSLGYTNTATANSKTGISINTTVAGGSVGKPSITISDPGHSHKEN